MLTGLHGAVEHTCARLRATQPAFPARRPTLRPDHSACRVAPGRRAQGRTGTESCPCVSPGYLLLSEPLQGLPAVCGDRTRLGCRVGPPRGLTDAPLRQAERLLLDLQDSDLFHGSVRPAASLDKLWHVRAVPEMPWPLSSRLQARGWGPTSSAGRAGMPADGVACGVAGGAAGSRSSC